MSPRRHGLAPVMCGTEMSGLGRCRISPQTQHNKSHWYSERFAHHDYDGCKLTTEVCGVIRNWLVHGEIFFVYRPSPMRPLIRWQTTSNYPAHQQYGGEHDTKESRLELAPISCYWRCCNQLTSFVWAYLFYALDSCLGSEAQLIQLALTEDSVKVTHVEYMRCKHRVLMLLG